MFFGEVFLYKQMRGHISSYNEYGHIIEPQSSNMKK